MMIGNYPPGTDLGEFYRPEGESDYGNEPPGGIINSVKIQPAFGLWFIFLSVCSCLASTRHYYIAAEDVTWNYAPSGHNLLSGTPIPQPRALKMQWGRAGLSSTRMTRSRLGNPNPTG